MPILTAIRHERPWKDWVDESHPFSEADQGTQEHLAVKDAWLQWFEMTPYKNSCDELEERCPTLGLGRLFEKDEQNMQLYEQSLALLLGLCTSTPAGPLTSYLGNAIYRQLLSATQAIWLLRSLNRRANM